MPGSLRIIAPGFSGESQSRAGLDFHHELVIYCFKLTVRRFTGAGSVLQLLHIVAWFTQSHGCQISNV